MSIAPMKLASPWLEKFKSFSLDDIGLVIIGSGASVFYLVMEKLVATSQTITIIITIALILLISVFTQILLNQINRSRSALQELNQTLDYRVRVKTAELRRSENRYRTIFENTGTATIIVNPQMVIVLANSEFTRICGLETDELVGKLSWLEFIDGESRRKLLYRNGNLFGNGDSPTPQNIECQFTGKDLVPKDMFISYAMIPGTGNYVVSLMDISPLKEAERQIYHQAFHDNLTGLPNRSLFMEHLTQAMKRSKRHGEHRFAVLYLDIDRFKLINDSLGHVIGDQLLKAFAVKVQEALRDIDTMARLGGDEFVILLEDMDDYNYAARVAQRLLELLREPFVIEGNEIYAQASFGIVLNSLHYQQPEYLIRDADAAMYHAKEKGRAQYAIFDQRLHEKATRLLRLETELRKAIKQRQFELHYQPIVSLETEQVIGFEALIRWHHPELGVVYPDSFIPVAEDTGLIVPIGHWVMLEACHDLVRWQKMIDTPEPIFISVNISSKQILRSHIIEEIKEIIKETGIKPSQLKLEITETALMEDTEQTIDIIQRLKKIGLQIVIDDFGTGYSAMSYLQRLPIDALKVDRSFISRISQTADENSNIVQTIIALAHTLNLSVVAEGVETAEQHNVLSEMKCQLAQGYLFSKPLAKERIDRLLDKINQHLKDNPQSRYELKRLTSP